MSGNLCTQHKNFHIKLERDKERECESRSVCKRVCVHMCDLFSNKIHTH